MDNDFNYLDLDPEIEDEPNPSNIDDNPNINLDPVDSPTTVEEPTEEDLITSFLKTKGIKDPTAIKQLDDNGEIQTVDFNSLSREEQLNILGSSDLDNNYGLDDEETQFISALRDNNLSINDYLNYVKNRAIEEYLENNAQPEYSIDSLSDEDLYLLDLKYKFNDVTEDEAAQYLEHEKSNETLWKKKIEALRSDYKAKEAEQIEQQKLIDGEEERKRQQAFQDSMMNAINGLKTIETFDLEDDDRDRIAEFILGTDATGTNYMYRALQDPENVAKMAWFLLDGADSIKALNDYWTDVVKKTSQSKYEEGYQDAVNKKVSKIKPSSSKVNKFIDLGNSANFLDLD